MARVGMAAPAVDQVGPLLVARLETVRTAWMERTTGRDEDERRRSTFDRNEPAALLVDVGDRLEKAPRVGVERLREDLVASPELGGPTRVHDHHRLRDVGDDAEVVRD